MKSKVDDSPWQLPSPDEQAAFCRNFPYSGRPERVAVYGTLQTGGSAWRLMRPLVIGRGYATTLPGTLYDTSYGYPALKLDGGAGVPAQVFRLRAPISALAELDEYEGPEYERIVLRASEACWVYVWRSSVAGMRPLSRGWL